MARSAPYADPPPQERPLAEVLAAVSEEIAALAETGEQLQALVGVLITHSHKRPDEVLIEEAQGLDALVQRLDALKGFLTVLSQEAPMAWRLDIDRGLSGLSLSDLARRLGRDGALSAHDDVASGDFDLF